MAKQFDRKLILENGLELYGYGFGSTQETISEIVFNTSMVGYQEIVSDPSYTDQSVVMTYPLIGNYGITDEDFEGKTPMLSGLIVREYNDLPSNFRYTRTLSEILEEAGVPGISGLDTRRITRIIRDEGSMKVMLCDASRDTAAALEEIRGYELRRDAVQRASSKKRWYSRTSNPLYNVVVIDCGIKRNIIRCLNERGCNITVLPFDAQPAEILKLNPDGLFISNGPGNPENAACVIELVRKLKGSFPMFGICLGMQIIALAYGARAFKMKFGHRGGNHPVMDMKTGKLEITSQNHSYAIDLASLEGTALTATHLNLLDNTVEGVECKEDKLFAVQYHPESAPGPQDSAYLFDKFILAMKEGVSNA